MISSGPAAAGEAVFDLDFRPVLHRGRDPVPGKHCVPGRSQRSRPVLTFSAQDSGTRNPVYANAGPSKAAQAREVTAFRGHWKQTSGTGPAMLVTDQKATTRQVPGEPDARRVRFPPCGCARRHWPATSPACARRTSSPSPLGRPGRFAQPARPRVHEDPAVKLTACPGTVRQLTVTGPGHDRAAVVITSDQHTTTRNLISQHARRVTIEQRPAEITRAFCAGALSSTVNLNADLDATLAVLARAPTAALRARQPGCAAATPGTIQRRFPETPGQVITTGDTVTVRLQRRACSPAPRKARPPAATTVPWRGNRTLHYELA